MSQTPNTDPVQSTPATQGIWQRLPEETPDSYAAFCAYLEMGPDSTLHQVAEKIGRTPDAVRHLSWRYHWQERAASYRQHLSNATLLAAQREHAKQAELSRVRDHIFRQQLWETSQILFTACHQGLRRAVVDAQTKMAPYELANLVNLCLRLGARANQPSQFTCEGTAPPSPDFDAAVEKVYGSNLTLEQVEELLKTFPPPKTLPSSNTKPAPTDPKPTAGHQPT